MVNDISAADCALTMQAKVNLSLKTKLLTAILSQCFAAHTTTEAEALFITLDK